MQEESATITVQPHADLVLEVLETQAASLVAIVRMLAAAAAKLLAMQHDQMITSRELLTCLRSITTARVTKSKRNAVTMSIKRTAPTNMTRKCQCLRGIQVKQLRQARIMGWM